MCKYSNVNVNVNVCKYSNVNVCKYSNVNVCKYSNVNVCKYSIEYSHVVMFWWCLEKNPLMP